MGITELHPHLCQSCHLLFGWGYETGSFHYMSILITCYLLRPYCIPQKRIQHLLASFRSREAAALFLMEEAPSTDMIHL